MPTTLQPLVVVCSTHMVAEKDGVWSRRYWTKTMAERFTLQLREGICPRCAAEGRLKSGGK
jgi:hypothetical protein